MDKVCGVEGCESSYDMKRGMCNAHYLQASRGKREFIQPSAYGVKKTLPCKHDGCTKVVRRAGYCDPHSQQYKKYGKTWNVGESQSECSWEGCTKKTSSYKETRCGEHKNRCIVHDGDNWCMRGTLHSGGDRLLCGMHSQRLTKHGFTGPVGEMPGNFFEYIGDWRLDGGGYRVRKERTPGGETRLVREHRMVMEEMLGRKLLPGENVHHVNGQRDQNFPSNLELWTVSQPSGQRVEDKINWAKEFLEQYGYSVNKVE